MDQAWLESFREKLDNHYAWPSLYTFKFIVPKGKEAELRNLFPMHNTTERTSQNANYTSLTVSMMMPSSDSIVKIYVAASAIEGIIAL